MDENDYHLKYPIGQFQEPAVISEELIDKWIQNIKDFPTLLIQEVNDLNEEILQKTYRPNGWTIKQVVHHCADSHMNSFIRFKLALTEENPTIKPYQENLWAELPDVLESSIYSSLQILEGLHNRWTQLLENLTEEDLNKSFQHPETGKKISLKLNIGIYSWHCRHHLAHIINAKNQLF